MDLKILESYVTMCDVNKRALHLANRNMEKNKIRGETILSDKRLSHFHYYTIKLELMEAFFCIFLVFFYSIFFIYLLFLKKLPKNMIESLPILQYERANQW